MFHSLYSRIAVGLAALFLFVGVLFVGVTVFSTDMYQQEVNQKLNIRLAGQIVKERLLMREGIVNEAALEEIFHMLMVINPGIEIYLLDINGKILTYSAPKGSVKRISVDMGPVEQWLRGDLAAPLLGDDPKDLGRKKVFSVAPIRRENRLEGYLYVILGGEEYDSVVQKLKASYVLQLSLWMMGAGLLFALAAGLVLFALLTGRLKRLTSVVDAFRRGEVTSQQDHPPSPVSGPSDEIDLLSATFWEMARQIENQMAELRAADQMRRELVANVSHDLRTPLATLQGYIETLLIKENQYTWPEQKAYLEIAIAHCRRLNKLVGELLELARLESARMAVQAEPFNIGELVADVVQKFSLAAEAKQITVTRRFDPGALFVSADIGLIERAVENLMDNAFHYTPENGEIRIGIYLDGDVVVEISDSGPGIPEAELPYIFDRFYQAKTGSESGRGHSGLGLAITRKIIRLHGRDIRAASPPGKGAAFRFSLARARLK